MPASLMGRLIGGRAPGPLALASAAALILSIPVSVPNVMAAGPAPITDSVPAVCFPPLIQGVVDRVTVLTGQFVTVPHQGAEVDLVGADGQTVASVTTDAVGAYTFAQVANGTYTVRFSAVGFSAVSRVVTVISTETQIEPAVFLFGQAFAAKIKGVVTASGGAAITGADVVVSDAAGDFWTATTDAAGGYEVDGLPLGVAVQVEISAPGYTTDSESLTTPTTLPLPTLVVDVSLRRPDSTAPSVTATADRPPDSNDWYRSPLTITWTGTDPDDSPAAVTCTAPTSYSGPEGASRSVSGSCADAAGNSSSATFTFNFDSTPPVVTLTGPANDGVYRPDQVPAATCTTNDTTSGVQTPAAVHASGGAEGHVTVTCSGAADNAGNSSSDVTIQYLVDGTAPVVTLNGPVNGAVYRLGEVPATTCTTTDDLSGLTTAATLSISGGPEGLVTAACSGAQDNVGNAAASVSVSYLVDGTPPVVTLNGPVNGATYRPSEIPVATCTTSDGLSGIATAATLSISGGPEGSVTATCSGAQDKVGNSAASVSVTYLVDGTPPLVTLTGPVSGATYRPSQVPVATCTTTDALSGIATTATLSVSGGPEGRLTATCSGAVDNAGNAAGPVSVFYFVDGTPPTITCYGASFTLKQAPAIVTGVATDSGSGPSSQSVSAVADTSSVGLKSVTLTASDAAGNVANKACSYTVGFIFSGFLAPVNNPGVVNTGKAGRTYPVKWQLKDAGGNFVTSLGAISSVTFKPTPCDAFTTDPSDPLETTSTGNTSLRYDAVTNQFVYNWSTPAKGCYTLFVNLAGGQSFAAYFKLS